MFGKRHCGALIVAVFAVLASAVSHAGERPKNLIVMIADGTGSQQYAFARWWKSEPLNIEKYQTGTLRTFSASSVTTDSAAAATAFATGVRTSAEVIGIGPAGQKLLPGAAPYDNVEGHPLATILEGAKLLGKATGIVATSRFSHATPAAYFSHAAHRDDENDIAEMGVYAGIDVVLAGGLRHLLPRVQKGVRNDDEDLTQVLRDRGYALALTAGEMRSATSGRLWGGFASSHMEPDLSSCCRITIPAASPSATGAPISATRL